MIEVAQNLIEERFQEFCKDFKKKGKFGYLNYKDFIHNFKNICHQYNMVSEEANFFDRWFVDKLHGKVYYEENAGAVIELGKTHQKRIKVRLVLGYIPLVGNTVTVQIKVPGSPGWNNLQTTPSGLYRVINALYY